MSNDGRWLALPILGTDESPMPAPGSASRISNMRHHPSGWWEPMGGAVAVAPIGAGTGEVGAVHWFRPQVGIRHLLVERRINATTSRISRVDFPSGAYALVTNRRRLDSGNDPGSLFVDSGRWCYIVGPHDRMVRWDGRSVYDAGYTGPPAPPRVSGRDQTIQAPDGTTPYEVFDLAAGEYAAGYNPSGTFNVPGKARGVGTASLSGNELWKYGYALSYINDLGHESPRSATVWATGANTVSGLQLIRVAVQRAPQGNIRHFRLWRTRNVAGLTDPGGASLYKHSTHAATTGIDLWDHTPDHELEELHDPNDTGAVPAGARTLAFWHNHAWCDGGDDDPSGLRYSAPLFGEQWPVRNRLPVGSARAGRVVSLIPLGSSLLVLMEGGVFIVKGNTVAGFRVSALSETVGCAAPRAVEVTPDLGVVFLANSGPHRVQGGLEGDQPTRVVPFGQEIMKTWRRQVGPALAGARSVYDAEHREVWWQVPEGGDPRPSLGIVYHTDIDRWSIRTGWNAGGMDYHDGRVWVGSYDDTGKPGVYLVTKGSRTRFGANLTGVVVTAPIRAPSRFTFHRVELTALATGASFTVETRPDRLQARVAQHETDPVQLHADHDRDVWGVATWDSGVWGDYELARVPVSVREPGALDHEVRVTMRRGMLLEIGLLVHGQGDLPAIPVRER